MANKAWVTLATNDTYALGALVLAHSLKKVNTAYKLVVLVSSNVTFAMRGTLQSVFDEVKEVNILDSGDTENLRLLARPELGITFTKFHCWKLTQFEKCVFLDADTLVLQNCDELFEREELSAAPDVGWPDCFNSGVFVFKPSEETFKALCDFAIAHGSFDGGDQGLLNMYFSDWATSDASKRLPFLFNLSSAAIYSYLPAFKWYGKGVKIVHFIGNSKPWQQPFNSSTRTVEAAPGSSHLQNFLQYWWDLFCAYVYPQLSPEMTRLLLRSWYTPRITIKNYPSRNNPMHNEVYIPELFVAPEVEEHFIFTDPWEEFEKNIAASVESSDNINVIGYRSTNDTEKSYNEIVHHNHKTYEEQPLVYNNYQPPVHKEHHHYDRLNKYSPPASDQTFIESTPVHNQCSVDVYSAPDVLTLTNYTVCDNRNHSSNDKPQNYENERINVNNETCITEDISHTSNSVKNSFSCDISVNYNSLHSLKNEILREETHYSETKSEINNDGGLANSLAQMKLEEPTPEQKARDDFLRKQNWEQGNIDYMGRDSFSNIWEKISQTMNFEPESKTEEKAATVQSSPASPTTTEQSSESSTKVDSVKSPTSILTSEQPISIPKSSEPAATKTVPSSPAPVPVSSQVASTTPVADESAPKSSAAPACPKPAPSAAAPVASTTPVPESTPAPTTPKPEAAPACPKPSSPAAAPVASTTPVPESTPAPTTTKPVAAPTCPKPAPSPSASAPVSSSTPVAEKSAPPPVTSKPVAAPACPKSAPSAPTPVAPTKPATESTPAPTPVCPKPAAPAAPAAKSSQEGKPAPSTKSSPSKK